MIDRLVLQDLVVRAEDPHDRRVRRIMLSRKGSTFIASIFNAGQEKLRALRSRLSDDDLASVARASELLAKAADEERGAA
ncbi:MAG TPA: MarR family transcriptional regulator, partial [Actinoplanes sp.]